MLTNSINAFTHTPSITLLEEWVAEAPKGENRTRVQRKIQEFLRSPSRNLDLSNLNLTSFPDIFNDPSFNELKDLNFDNNQLTTLPESLGSLQALTKLFLNNNQIGTLPESLGNLQALTKLSVENNQLTTLPESLGNLRALTHLYLESNQLRSLPESLGNLQALTKLSVENNQLTTLPESLGNLRALTHLYLEGNQLTTLPESLGNLRALTHLYLEGNQLTTLPESLGNLRALTHLYLEGNQLTTLPESLGNLRALTHLYLERNQLRSLPESLGNLRALTHLGLTNNVTLYELPEEILQLRSHCHILLERCGLSRDIMARLREIMNDPNYSGPRISYSIFDRGSEEERSITESLKHLYAIIGETPRQFAKLEKTSGLRSWLHRLSHTADYQSGGALQKAFAEKILDYLSQADKDEGFRTTFYQVIQDASSTCGDRVALSILHLSIAYQLATIDLTDMKELANFLIKGPWTLELLQEIARNKIPFLPLHDEIEVYLGYPIKLKEVLEIPIDVQNMLYFACSALKPKDLENAKNHVLSKQKNQEECCNFLTNHSTWVKSLSINYPEKYQAILNKRTEATEQENPDYNNIEKEWKKDLVVLTEKVLQS